LDARGFGTGLADFALLVTRVLARAFFAVDFLIAIIHLHGWLSLRAALHA
jgi:hypothetical protein